MKTFSQKPASVIRHWYVIDASEASFGRIATKAAALLIGKGKPTFTPHTDGGDYVVIINASQLVASGAKLTGKTYYHHSGFPGGIYGKTLADQQKQDPTKIFYDAVKGMLPHNKLQTGRLARLKIYPGPDHNHTAQSPQPVNIGGSK